MSETPKYDFSGASFTSFGSVTGDIKGDNIIGIQHKYAPEQKLPPLGVAIEAINAWNNPED
jgi:hypothetical protein